MLPPPAEKLQNFFGVFLQFQIGVDSVACGCCVKVCPLSAIQIWCGIRAAVNEEQCVGCGKCAKECPASVIEIQEVQA